MSGDGDGARTLTGLVTEHAERAPEAPAIIFGDGEVSFANLDRAGRRQAQALLDLDVGPGDHVALWLPDLPAWLTLCLACARLGAVAVAINTRFKSSEVEDILRRSGAKVLAFAPGFKDIDFAAILGEVDASALENLESVILWYEDPGEMAPDEVLGRRAFSYAEIERRLPLNLDLSEPEGGAAIFTTSGTTKAPKLILHSQEAIIAHAREVARDFGYDAKDAVILQALPLCGVFGFCQAMAALAAGRPMVLMPAFDANEAAALVARHRVTHMNGGDDMFHRMLAASKGAKPLSTLRLCGFAAFNPALGGIVAEAEARGLGLVGLYGMSEVQALFARQRPEAESAERARAGGYPVAPEARVRVRDPESGALLGHGESGELELKGPSQMMGYFGDEDATAAVTTEDGFIRSGDLGYTTEDGGFVFLARMGDVLRLGGFLVSPAEIEARVQEHATVSGCQVVGATATGGPVAVAFVTLEPGAALDAEALAAWCAAGMAKYKVPARFIALDAFPTTKSANGVKIQRARLREIATAEVG